MLCLDTVGNCKLWEGQTKKFMIKKRKKMNSWGGYQDVESLGATIIRYITREIHIGLYLVDHMAIW